MNTIEQFHLKQILQVLAAETGIVVSEANSWQVQQRIKTLCKKYEIPSFYRLRQRLQHHQKYLFWDELMECVLVQESYFFRDKAFFVQLETDIIPALLTQHCPIRIWSAAAAQGQEIYSIAMMAHKTNTLSAMELYASDISNTALQYAESGLYSYASLQRSISHEDIACFFEQHHHKWRFRDDIRSRVSFFRHNLMHPCGRNNFYHIIIIKNMLLYLSSDNRKKVIRNAQKALHKDGILIISNPNTQLVTKGSTL